MAQLKDTTIKGALEVESSVLLNNNIEFKRTYIGPDGTETVSYTHLTLPTILEV